METQEISFDQREEGQPIVFTGSAEDVSEGCEVDLKHDGLRVSAKIVKFIPREPWVGEVTDVPESNLGELGSLKIGSTIRFQSQHIFRCAA